MTTNKAFIQGLQGLRGFAIFLVIISHCNWALNKYGNNILTYAGAWGVSCFIMLSGFLAVERHYGTEFRLPAAWKMMKHKIRKCYPLHLLSFFIAIPLSVSALISQFGKTLCKAAFNLTLTQTVVPVSSVYFSFNAVSWYLSLDIILVLFLPLVLFILRKINVKITVCSIVFVVALQATVAVLVGRTPIAHWIVYICPVTRILDYFVGGSIAVLVRKISHKRDNRYRGLMYSAMFFGMIFLIFSMHTDCNIFLSSVWTLPNTMILLGIYRTRKENSLFTWKPLVFIGNISFEIFMFHQLVIRYCSAVILKLGLVVTWWCYGLMIMISVVVALLYRERKYIWEWIKRRNEQT